MKENIQMEIVSGRLNNIQRVKCSSENQSSRESIALRLCCGVLRKLVAQRLLAHLAHGAADASGFAASAVRQGPLESHERKQDFVRLGRREMHLGLARIDASQERSV